MTRFVVLLVIHVHPTEKDNLMLVETLNLGDCEMKDGCDRLFERAFQAWIGQRLHGLSGDENVQGGCLGGSKT